jgi:crossover junction endonuclease EME1
LGLFSSDSLDVSFFNHDNVFDEPAKKRRRSIENPSPLRQTTTTSEAALPERRPSWLFSDDDFGLPPSNPAVLRRQAGRDMEGSDPIVFTSSAPQPVFQPKPPAPRKSNVEDYDVITLDEEDDDPFLKPPEKTKSSSRVRNTQDTIEEFSDPFTLPGFTEFLDVNDEPEPPVSNTVFSSKTAELLSSLNTDNAKSRPKNTSRSQKPKVGAVGGISLPNVSDGDEVEEPVAPRRAPKKSGKLPPEEKEARARARAEAKVQKELEKEQEKKRKQKLKEEKAKEKQLAADITEVNKAKVDKKDSTPEMIIDIGSSIEETSVGNQIIEYMKRLGVDHNFVSGPISNVVKWRRKRNARYNEAAGHWEPCPFHIQEEKHVLCLVPAQDFVDMVIPAPIGEARESLEVHVLRLKSAYPDHTIIYLIEGLTTWMRKNRNSRNRAYQAEVLRQYEQSGEEGSTMSRGRGRKTRNKPENTPPVDDDTIEDALLALQVTHSCLIHHSNAPAESAEWIKNFTEHISTIPYRRERMEGNDAAFCMDVGQVKSGEDKLDTFVKMLQEVNRVTASMAYGITNQYPSVTDLVRGMRMHGPTMLEDVKKSANKNGALTDSRVGPAASKRLYKVFTGLDPTSTDV